MSEQKRDMAKHTCCVKPLFWMLTSTHFMPLKADKVDLSSAIQLITIILPMYCLCQVKVERNEPLKYVSLPPTCDVFDQSACVDSISALLESRMIKHIAAAVAVRK